MDFLQQQGIEVKVIPGMAIFSFFLLSCLCASSCVLNCVYVFDTGSVCKFAI